jgi:DNA modification methylase
MKGSEHNEKRCHPTQKPIQLAVECFELFDAGHRIFDGFLGSGTTLIAAEKLNRTCYGMEIDPKYCDVIIKRYADYVGASEESIRKTRENPSG